jgi:O-antigen/teichoic acid export membrane protein
MGLLAVAMSAYFIGALITDMGITTFLAARVDEPDLASLRGTYLATRLVVVLIFGLAFAAATMLSLAPIVEMIAIGLFGGGLSAIGDDWVLMGRQRFGMIVLQQSVGRLVYLVLLLAILPQRPTAEAAMVCLIVSGLIPVAWSWFRTIRDYGPPSRPTEPIALLRTGGPVLAARLLENTYEQGAATLFAPALSHHTLGIFTAGDRPVQAAGSLLDAVGWSLLPRMAARRDDHDDFWTVAFRMAGLVAVMGAVAAAFACLLAPWFIPLLFGNEFLAAVPLLQVEAWVLPGMAVASFLSTAILPVRQDTTGVVVGASIGATIALLALAFAFQTHSAMTVVIGIVVAETTVAVFYLLRTRALRAQARPAEVQEADA